MWGIANGRVIWVNHWNGTRTHARTHTHTQTWYCDCIIVIQGSALLVLYEGNPPATGGLPSQRASMWEHYKDVMISAMSFQITSFTIVYSTVYSGADQRKHQSSATLAFVRGIHRWPVNSPHKGPVTRKMFPFDDVIMKHLHVNTSEWAGWRLFCWFTCLWRSMHWFELCMLQPRAM